MGWTLARGLVWAALAVAALQFRRLIGACCLSAVALPYVLTGLDLGSAIGLQTVIVAGCWALVTIVGWVG